MPLAKPRTPGSIEPFCATKDSATGWRFSSCAADTPCCWIATSAGLVGVLVQSRYHARMQPAPPPPPVSQTPRPRGNAGRRFLLVLILLAAAFLGGYVPQWLEVRNLRASLETADLQLQLVNAHRMLGVASQEAQRNNYASAAQAASQFFDQCALLVRNEAFEKEPRTRVALTSYAQQRDEVMALLSAADPAARERLAGLFLTMEGVIERRE